MKNQKIDIMAERPAATDRSMADNADEETPSMWDYNYQKKRVYQSNPRREMSYLDSCAAALCKSLIYVFVLITCASVLLLWVYI